MNIINFLDDPHSFKNITYDDVGGIADEIFILMENKIDKNSLKFAISTTNGNFDLPKAAFKDTARKTIKKAIISYCAAQKWEQNIPIIPYITKALNRTMNNTIDDVTCATNKAVVRLICPACKEFGMKEFLEKDGDFLFCKKCRKDIEILQEELNVLKGKLL
jgi:hypothetical protein